MYIYKALVKELQITFDDFSIPASKYVKFTKAMPENHAKASQWLNASV